MNLALPPLARRTRVTVVIPARDEATTIPHALAALDAQLALDGTPLERGLFDIVVLANGCRDATASVARAHEATRHGPRIAVLEIDFPAQIAHIGTARRAIMDAAATRFLRAGKRRGILASTDADTRVDACWIAATLDEMTRVDAVTGRIVLARAELTRLDRVARALYLRDAAHRRIVGELEAMRDPVDHDPLPRHGQHYGASFAVTAEAYVRAGGIPPYPKLEDLAFYGALERIDARVRHSMRVRVATSARARARVAGGFGTFLGDLGSRGTLAVEAPTLTILRLDARAALRRMWRGIHTPSDARTIFAAYGCTRAGFRDRFDRGDPFGENLARMEAFAGERWARYAPVAVEMALPAVRALRAASNAACPMRRTIASGAG